jgi:parvulin-like peptidyl-prolyl cis-trans isomerase-like protein
VHVLVLGVLVFTIHRAVAPPRASQEIVVSASALDGMREDFRRRTGHLPSPSEEQAMVDAYVGDEILVREGLSLGLDRGDIIVRRRLIQKMEFLLESSEPVPPPTDAELAAYLAAHADRYGSPARVSFTHVFVATSRGGDGAARSAVLKAELDGGADPGTLGDPFLRGRDFRVQSQAELAGIFGAAFAAEVARLPEGAWSAPIRSSFGWHVIRVSEKRAATAPTLAAVRERVERDWRAERRATLDAEARARLRARYVVRVEGAGP